MNSWLGIRGGGARKERPNQGKQISVAYSVNIVVSLRIDNGIPMIGQVSRIGGKQFSASKTLPGVTVFPGIYRGLNPASLVVDIA